MLAQLPQPSCPVADVVVQQYLGKILAHLKKQLQVRTELLGSHSCSLGTMQAMFNSNAACVTIRLVDVTSATVA